MDIHWVKTATPVIVPATSLWVDILEVDKDGVSVIVQDEAGVTFMSNGVPVGIPWSNIRFIVFKES